MDMYGKAQAKEILKYCKLGEYLTIDDRGVWPGVDRDDMLKGDTELLRWKPARVFRNDPNPPDVANTPSLPFPFSAKKLAAFMLSGTGALVVGFYGVWQDGPDPDSLAEIDIDCNLARTALVGVYAAYREAEKRVDALDANFWKRAAAARRRYNDARSAALEREKVAQMPPLEADESDKRDEEYKPRHRYNDARSAALEREQVAQMPRLEAGDSNESKAERAERDKRKAERDEEYKLGRARALEPLKALHEEMRRSETEEETAYQNWLSAMVRQLLAPDDTQTHAALVVPIAPADSVSQAASAQPDDTVAARGVEVPAWNLSKPQRYQGYAKPLYLLLQTAHNAKQRRPTAREVIDAFAASKPNEIAQILPNGFDYYDAKGGTKGATLAAIGETISRMTAKTHD